MKKVSEYPVFTILTVVLSTAITMASETRNNFESDAAGRNFGQALRLEQLAADSSSGIDT